MSDQKRIEIDTKHGPVVHVRGYHGDDGENEGVLAISVVTDGESPLIEGDIPDLGGFSCSPDAADQLADVLRSAAATARKAMSEGR